MVMNPANPFRYCPPSVAQNAMQELRERGYELTQQEFQRMAKLLPSRQVQRRRGSAYTELDLQLMAQGLLMKKIGFSVPEIKAWMKNPTGAVIQERLEGLTTALNNAYALIDAIRTQPPEEGPDAPPQRPAELISHTVRRRAQVARLRREIKQMAPPINETPMDTAPEQQRSQWMQNRLKDLGPL